MPGTVGRSGGDRKSGGVDLFPHDGLPEMPRDLDKDEQYVWNALLEKLPCEMLRGVDMYELAVLSRNIVRSNRYAVKESQSLDYKEELAYSRARVQAEAQVEKFGKLFGLNPKDRQSIKFEKQIEDDATEWINE